MGALDQEQIRKIVIDILQRIDIFEAYIILATLMNGKKDLKTLFNSAKNLESQVFSSESTVSDCKSIYETYLILLEHGAIELNSAGEVFITDIGISLYYELVLISHITSYSALNIN